MDVAGAVVVVVADFEDDCCDGGDAVTTPTRVTTVMRAPSLSLGTMTLGL